MQAVWIRVVLFLALSLSLQTQGRELVIAGVEEAPLKMFHNRNYFGIDIDVVKEAMKRMGVPHRFTLLDVGGRMLRLAELGQVDMVLAVSRKPVREAYLHYPEVSYLELSWHFFIRAEDAGKIAFDHYGDLLGRRIGATQGYAYTRDFWKSGLELMVVTSNDQQIPLLLAGRVDAIPLNLLVARYELKLAGTQNKVTYLPNPISTSSYYDAFAKASNYPNLSGLVKKYDATLRMMQADGTIKAIYDRYLE